MKKLLILLALVCLALPSFAQNGAVLPMFYPFVDLNGVPLAGGYVYSYAAGTSTPLATYTDATLATQNPNPVQLDATGWAQIWLGASAYKIVITDVNGVIMRTVDNISAPGLGIQNGTSSLSSLTVTGNGTIGGTFAISGATTLSSTLSVGGNLSGSTESLSGNFSAGGNATISGTASISGTATIGGNTSVTGTLSATGQLAGQTLSIGQTPLTGTLAQGGYLGWNYLTGTGEVDLWDSPGTGGGGFAWFSSSAVGSGGSTVPWMQLIGNEGGRLVLGSVRLTQQTGTQPSCASGNRGLFFLVAGNGTTTADSLQVCALTASGSYVWKVIF